MRKIVLLTFLLFSFSEGSFVSAQLIVSNDSPYNNAAYLVQSFLLGQGVVASNIVLSKGNLTQMGFFNGQNSNIGIDSGIVLCSGNINIALGPNNAGGAGTGYNGQGDPDLQLIAGIGTLDASVLEFDFIPSGDTVIFRYVFASEEYHEYVCASFSDAFGFFLSGPGITGPFSNNSKNIALIPGTNTGVSINSINNGSAGAYGSASNCISLANSSLFTSNSLNTTQFDGFTKVLNAISAVQCGSTYHVKIAVCDASDAIYDSGVFLECGSFTSNAGEIGLSVSATDVSCNDSCNGSALVSFTEATSLLWSNGMNDSMITGLCPGQYQVTITTSDSCKTVGVATINSPYLPVGISHDNSSCFGICDGAAFALSPDSVYFYWSTGQAGPNATGLCAGNHSLTATTTDSTCTVIFPFIILQPDEIILNSFATIDTGYSGYGTGSTLASGGNPPYSYLWSDSAQQTNNTATGLSLGTYFVTVTDFAGCEKVDSIIVSPPAGTILNQNSEPDLSVFPNPNTGIFSVPGMISSVNKIDVINLLGEVIYSQVLNSGNTPGFETLILDLRQKISDGVYFLHFISDGKSENVKFVKYTVH